MMKLQFLSMICIEKNVYSIISKAFNWQQGTRAQWLDTKHFIFNDFDEVSNQYISRIASIEKKKIVNEFGYQVCSAYSNLFSISELSKNLFPVPEYGYSNLSKLSNYELNNLKNDGIKIIDLKEKNPKFSVSIDDVINVDYQDKFSRAYHMIIHISISPDGKNFIFIHRYYIKNIRYDRLMLCNIKSKKINCLCNEQIVSHFYWKNNEEVLAYLKYSNHLGYWLIDIKSIKFTELRISENDQTVILQEIIIFLLVIHTLIKLQCKNYSFMILRILKRKSLVNSFMVLSFEEQAAVIYTQDIVKIIKYYFLIQFIAVKDNYII